MRTKDAVVRRMIQEQLIARGIQSADVLDAMRRVPREAFVQPEQHDYAYADQALPIECDQTISQPYIVALMTEALRLTGIEHVLEIGTGSGYQTAILAELAGSVVTVERHAPLSDHAKDVLRRLGYHNVRFVIADGTDGFAEEAPYDRIIVTAAAARCPSSLFAQLREGGIVVIPVGSYMDQTLQCITKENGQANTNTLTPCRFVPLVGRDEP